MTKTTGHKEDVVNNPSHYKGSKGLEVMEVLENFLTPEELKGFYKGNVIKYILRSDKKNVTEDLNKALKYLGWLSKEPETVDLLETICGPIQQPKEFTEFSVLLFNKDGDVTSKTFFKSKEEAEQFAEATGGDVCLK